MNGRKTRLALAAATMIVLGASVLPLPAQAQIYKCTDAKGRVQFMDAPCAPGSKGAVVDVQPNIIDASGERKAIAREQTANAARATSAPMTSQPGSLTSASGGNQPATIDPAACASAESDYQSARSTAGTPTAELNAKAAATYAACGTSPPRRVIGARTNLNNQGVTSPGSSGGPR
jgi:hypothetical protein